MHILKRIEIRGFRGQTKIIRFNLHPNANFIIGRNGTGKTTLINLINSALRFDADQLQLAKFDSITIKFRSIESKKTPIVTVKKVPSDYGDEIYYFVQDSAQSKKEEFALFQRPRRVQTASGKMRLVVPPRKPLRTHLRGLFNVTWLSLQRRDTQSTSEDFEFDYEDIEDASQSDVDKKVSDVLVSIGQYFSRLDSIVADETQIFQRKWFLSFLASDRHLSLGEINHLNDIEERQNLISIFNKFDMGKSNYEEELHKHFDLLGKSKKKLSQNTLNIHDAVVLSDSLRLHSLVERWQKLQQSQKNVYYPKTEFTKILSDMFYRKQVSVGRNNTINISSDNGEPIPMNDLSSGEKQLLIFLSETLLQESDPYIFLADEPELSLHVEWQEDLVPSLLKMNPNAQVLFATHSPDIVNEYQKNVVQMEDLVE